MFDLMMKIRIDVYPYFGQDKYMWFINRSIVYQCLILKILYEIYHVSEQKIYEDL